MKVHKNQWLWDGPYSPDHLSGALSRGHTMAPEGQTPSQRPEMAPPHSDVDLQPLENKALSWGIIRKSACILAAITIRKSQPVVFSYVKEFVRLSHSLFRSFSVKRSV